MFSYVTFLYPSFFFPDTFPVSTTRFADGMDGPRTLSSCTYRLDSHNWRRLVSCTYTRKDSAPLKISTIFCKFHTSVESKILIYHHPKPSSWQNTMNNSLPCSGYPKTISSTHLPGTSTTHSARNTIRV